jgi:integrase/recombinase XerD
VPTRGAAEALLRRFLEELRLRRYSASSIDKARGELPRFFLHLREQGVSDVRAVDEAQLAAYARHLAERTTRRGGRLSLWSRSSSLSTLRRFFAFLARAGLILRNPAQALPLPKARRLPRGVLTEAQARRLVAAPFPGSAIGKRDRAILETLYGTGLRLGEAVRADVLDLDLHQGVLLVRNGKGRKDRMVPVPGRAAFALDTYLTDARLQLVRGVPDPALFLSRYGRRLSAIGLRALVVRHGRAVGLALTPHVLRHACATHLLHGGADIRHVQELLGHRSLTTTALYTRVDLSDLRDVLLRAHPRERAGASRKRR